MTKPEAVAAITAMFDDDHKELVAEFVLHAKGRDEALAAVGANRRLKYRARGNPLRANPDWLRATQWVRFGQVFAAAADYELPEPGWPRDVPLWFMVLQDFRTSGGHSRSDGWNPSFFGPVLKAGGIDDSTTVATHAVASFFAILKWMSSWSKTTKDAGDWVTYVNANVDCVPAAMAQLDASCRVTAIEWLRLNVDGVAALAPLLADSAVCSAKTVREVACRTIAELPEPLRSQILATALTAAKAGTIGTVITCATGLGEPGRALLVDALAQGRGGKRDELMAGALSSSVGDSESPETELVVPPAPPLDSTPLGDDFVTGLRATLDQWTARLERQVAQTGIDRARVGLDVFSAISTQDLVAVRDWLNGEHGKELDRGVDLLRYMLGEGMLRTSELNLPLVSAVRLASLMDSRSRWLSQVRALAGEDYDLRNLAEAAEIAGVDDPVAVVRKEGMNSQYPSELVWPFFAEHPGTDLLPMKILAMFPVLPKRYVHALSQIASGEVSGSRREAQELLGRQPNVLDIAANSLTSGKGEVRAAAAKWIGQIGDPAGVALLRAAWVKEKRDEPKTEMLLALHALGDDIATHLTPQVLATEAAKGLKAKRPASIDWFPFDSLPACGWADGTVVDPQILQWWVVRAAKLKDPAGTDEIGLYLSLLNAASRAALGTFVVDTWVAHDTRRDEGGDYVGDALPARGVLGLARHVPGVHIAAVFERFYRDHAWRYYPEPGARYARRNPQLEALLTVAASSADPEATRLVLTAARDSRRESVRWRAGVLADQTAERQGWSRDQLADRTIPAAGLEADGTLALDYGSRQFVAKVTRTRTGAFALAVSSADGRPVKTLPTPGPDDDPDLAAAAKAQLAASKKDLTHVVNKQKARLIEAMNLNRLWDTATWCLLAEHPLMRHLVATLVWKAQGPTGDEYCLFRPTPEGDLLDATDETFVIPADARISLAHSATTTPEEIARWQEHLADYEVMPLFAQFMALTPPVLEPRAKVIDDHRGWLSSTAAIRRRATERGYSRYCPDRGQFTAYSKDIPGAGVTAIVTFTGSFIYGDHDEREIPAAVEHLAFSGTRTRICDIPPIVLANAYDDYVYIAEAGHFDPEWESKAVYWYTSV
ncbi:MAG: DUF4132 domain-containing protein [Micrococcales bacterium]|nr:DUF4132 domain-containing protein [Micrococcales bacterium]